MSFNIEIDSDNEEIDVKSDTGFDFELPKSENKNINILNDTALFNKANISNDVLSLSSRSENNSESDLEEYQQEFKSNNFPSKPIESDTSSSKSSKSSIVIRKASKKPNFKDELSEKREILYQFDRMKSKGHKIPYSFNMNSDLNEMRLAFDRIKHEKEIDSSIRFQRRMLMSAVTVVENLNNTYDPFSIELNGWSETIYDTLDDYDDIFEELHDKYQNTSSGIAPEFRLMLSLGGSAFMFNLTKKMFSQSNIPDVEDILKKNPDLMKQFQQASAEHYMQDNYGVPPPQMSSPKKEQPKTDLFSMFTPFFGNTFSSMTNEPTLDVDNIINSVHQNINFQPDQNDIEETLTVTDDDISQILENVTDPSKPFTVSNRGRKKGGKKKILDL